MNSRIQKIVASLFLLTSLQLTASTLPMIINRSGYPITVAFGYSGTPATTAIPTTGTPPLTAPISLSGVSAHNGDQMVQIPVAGQPIGTSTTNYINSVSSATVTITTGATPAPTVSIPSFAAGTSYIIVPTGGIVATNPATAPTTFIATPGTVTYTAAGVGTATAGFAIGAATGF